jgi:hypothetical protein
MEGVEMQGQEQEQEHHVGSGQAASPYPAPPRAASAAAAGQGNEQVMSGDLALDQPAQLAGEGVSCPAAAAQQPLGAGSNNDMEAAQNMWLLRGSSSKILDLQTLFDSQEAQQGKSSLITDQPLGPAVHAQLGTLCLAM